MGFFDRPQPVVAPVPEESKYSIEKVQELLNTFGMQRLFVHDALLKVLISRVTWAALPYLNRISGGKPHAGHIAEMLAKVEMLNGVLVQYRAIQNDSEDTLSKDEAGKLMASGFDAVTAYLADLSRGNASTQDLLDYKITTDYLSGKVASI